MKKILFFSIIALGAVMVSCNKPAQATEEKAEITKPASQEISAIRTANDLAKYGYEVESASALIEAANILASVPTHSLGPLPGRCCGPGSVLPGLTKGPALPADQPPPGCPLG